MPALDVVKQGKNRVAFSLRQLRRAALAGTALCLMSQAGHAIVLNDNAANDLGGIQDFYDSGNLFPNVVSLFSLTSDLSNCTGTLIDSRTILTAAHCVVNNQTGMMDSSTGSLQIRFAPNAHDSTSSDSNLSGAILHENYIPTVHQYDLAVLSLDKPVTEIAPVHLWREGDPLVQFGSLAVIAGYGTPGTGTNYGSYTYDSHLRYGETAIGALAPYMPGDHPTLLAQFRNPDDPFQWDLFGLSAAGVPVPYMQASPAPGDSGGPVFLVTPQGLIQIGTVIGTPGSPYGEPVIPVYGVIDDWMPVMLFRDWIDANSALRYVSSTGGDRKWSDAAGWRDAGNGTAVVPDNKSGNFDGRGTTGRYYMVQLAQSGTVDVDFDAVIDGLYVEHDKAGLHVGADRTLDVLTQAILRKGDIHLDGSIVAGRVDILGGVLHGRGVLTTENGLWNEAGTIAPQGKMTIVGNYVQSPDGTLQIGLGETTNDKLEIDGDAALSGSLKLVQTGQLSVGKPYTIVDASSVAGRFTSVAYQFRSAFLQPKQINEANSVNIIVARNALGFADIATTFNARSVARVLDEATNPLHANILQMDEVQAREAFNALGGAVFANLRDVGEGAAGRGLAAAMQHLSGMGGSSIKTIEPLAYAAGEAASSSGQTAAHDSHYSLWGAISAQWADGGVLNNNGHSINLGVDAQAEGWRVGLMLGRDDVSFRKAGQSFDGRSETYMLGAYAGTQWGNVTARFAAILGTYDMNTTRTISIAGLSETLKGNRRGTVAAGIVELGYRFELPRGVIEPFAGLEHRHGWGLNFTENGGISRLSVATPSSDTTIMSLGLRGEVPFSVSGVEFKVRGSAAWEHDIARSGTHTHNAFSNGVSFTQFGEDSSRNRARVQLGLDASLAREVTLGMNYEGSFGAGNQHGLRINLTGRF